MNTACLPRPSLTSDPQHASAAVNEARRFALRIRLPEQSVSSDPERPESHSTGASLPALVLHWLWLLPAWTLPLALGWTIDGSTAAAWLWLLLCGTCSLGLFFRLLASSGRAPTLVDSMDRRNVVLAGGALVLMAVWTWVLPAICLLLLLPASLLQTSACRMSRISRQTGMRSLDVEAARCRLQGMYIDLLRLFGALLLVGGAVWLTGQTELTNGALATLIGLMGVYIWGVTARLSRVLRIQNG